MAQTTTTTNTLGVGLEYNDTAAQRIKTAYLKIPNPKNNLTEQEIKTAVLTLINGEEPIIKDTFGNAFDTTTAIATAYTEAQEVIDIDTGYEG